MPVARIVTSVPELAGGLVRDLNSRGFEVYILSPTQTPSTEVDLEIRMDVAGAEAVAAIVSTSAAEAHSAEIHSTELRSDELHSEDIWALLSNFSGDEPEANAVVAAEPATAEQEPLATATLQNKNHVEAATLSDAEIKPAEKFEIIPGPLDPELVPSMFGLSNELSGNSNAASFASGLHREHFREQKNSWDSHSPRLAAAAAACAVIAIVLVLTLAHRRSPLPTAVNSPGHDATAQLPFHPATSASTSSTASIVPVKAVVTSDAVPAAKNTQRSPSHDIAEDTIVHFGSTVKAAPRQKQNGVRYYSDME